MANESATERKATLVSKGKRETLQQIQGQNKRSRQGRKGKGKTNTFAVREMLELRFDVLIKQRMTSLIKPRIAEMKVSAKDANGWRGSSFAGSSSGSSASWAWSPKEVGSPSESSLSP